MDFSITMQVYLTWLVWYGNALIMGIVLFNLIIVMLFQSYEQILGEMTGLRYK